MTTTLPCGCRTCGCICAAHSPTGQERPCDRHAVLIVTRWIAGEVAALAALILFAGMTTIWASVFSHF